MSAPRRENDPNRKPNLTVAQVKQKYGTDAWPDGDRAAGFINAKKLNIIDGSKGQTVGGNLAHAMDLAVGKGSEGRAKSLRKTHMNVSGKDADATAQKAYSSYEKYGDKYDN
jgi:hypothetical protein